MINYSLQTLNQKRIGYSPCIPHPAIFANFKNDEIVVSDNFKNCLLRKRMHFHDVDVVNIIQIPIYGKAVPFFVCWHLKKGYTTRIEYLEKCLDVFGYQGRRIMLKDDHGKYYINTFFYF